MVNKSGLPARVAIVAVITYHILLFALIVIRPDLDPYWHPISEWAIGPNGWIMVLAFLISATAYGALFITIRKEIRGVAGKIGLGILFICFIGTILVGVFVTDPMPEPGNVEAQEMNLTTTGMLHMMGGASALFLLPFAALLINLSIALKNKAFESAKKLLLLTGFIPLAGWIGFVIHLNLYIIPLGDYAYGPEVPLGWPPRLLLLTYAVWVIVLAKSSIRYRTEAGK
jgi:Protein of unknown function (DUF998)